MIRIELPDGAVKEVEKNIPAVELANQISRRLAKEALLASIDGRPVDLSTPLTQDARVQFHTFNDPLGQETYWHTTAHMLAQAVLRLRPDAKVSIGPPIENGFYYDFDTEPFKPEHLEELEREMAKISQENHATERIEMDRAEARALFEEMNEPYKLALLDDIPEDEAVSVYRQGEFTDLCRGPHIPRTGLVRHFKLLSSGGAYWRGDEKNKQLQRIYGVSYEKKSQLEERLRVLEESERRDHRTLGTQLDLYSGHPDVGGGLILWHPKGALTRHLIEEYWRERHLDGGYDFVYTPHIGKKALWETSGHLQFYAENMYAPMDMDGQEYFIKPMNCPFHILIYKSKLRSYRDLPMRFAELGAVYRYERAGTLHGMMRVRSFTQDDAHLFCRPEQMPQEIERTLRFCLDMLEAFGFDDFEVFLSTRPEKAVGEPEQWEAAQNALEAAIRNTGLPYERDEGGGAFYGPKIDVIIRDTLQRSWQCSTIQFDFNLPEQFDITYIGENGQPQRPYMVHRALLGSVERFFGVLVEHYAGAFPLWLAPVQAVVLPIADAHAEYAESVCRELKADGLRVETDARREKLGYKIREAELAKIPYMLVVGGREMESGQVSARSRHGENLGSMTPAELIKRMREEIEAKR
ncbi:MAG: threonine--tRNA ligase [Candidatus Poribacteria bacterium]|nr:threonine--tRNA ligase [Candidatus Poribacteria bacterium]